MPGDKYFPDGQKIRLWRKEKGYTNSRKLAGAISALAAAVPGQVTEIGYRTIDEAERGRPSTVQTLRAIAAVLGVGWKDLLLSNHPANQTALKAAANDFRDCLRELLLFENAPPSGAPVRVRVIAMDLSDTKDWLPVAIEKAASPSIEFEVLALTPETAALPPGSPMEVVAWSKNTSNCLEILGQRLRVYRGEKAISLTVKGYAAIPTTHGVEVTKGDSRHYALSRCVPLGGPIPSYDWGRDAYRIFPHDATDTDLIDLRDSFVHLFDEHWRVSSSLLLDMRPAAAS
jgi:transcriptional regulator with XRE-family HTH domain